MFDAHTHLQDPRLHGLLPQLLTAAEAAGIRGICSCSTSPADVASVRQLPRKHGQIQIVRGYGIHPWYAENARLETIEAALMQDPEACVGEIGLDGVRGVSPLQQRKIFEAQLELAIRLQRPVILHGARAWGELTDILKNFAPRLPGFLLHSFGGSPELARENLKLGAIFSFSGTLCNPQNTKARAVASVLPLPQILVETDTPDLFPHEGVAAGIVDGKPLNQPANLPLVLHSLAEIRGVAEDELRHATEENARRFFRA